LSPASVATLRPPRAGPHVNGPAPAVDPLTGAAVLLSVAALPLLTPAGPGNIAPADGLALLAVGTMLLRLGWTRERVRVPYLLGTGLLVAAGAASALRGDLPASGLLAVLQDLFLLTWAAALANFARRADGLRFLVDSWALSASCWGVGLVVAAGPSLLSGGNGGAPARATFTFGDENAAGFYFVLSMLVIVAARRPRRRSLRIIALACLALATVGSGSLGAISGLLAGVAVAVVLGVSARRGAALALAVAVALPVGVGSIVLLSERHHVVQAAHDSGNPLLRNSLGRGHQSSASRSELARETYELWRTSDAWGRGPVSTQHALRSAQAPYPKEAHNDWLAALVERGVLGVLGLLLLVAEIGLWAARSWDVRKLAPTVAAAVPAPQFVVGALATATIFSFTHEVLHDRSLWALLGLLAAIGIWGRSRPSTGTGGVS